MRSFKTPSTPRWTVSTNGNRSERVDWRNSHGRRLVLRPDVSTTSPAEQAHWLKQSLYWVHLVRLYASAETGAVPRQPLVPEELLDSIRNLLKEAKEADENETTHGLEAYHA